MVPGSLTDESSRKLRFLRRGKHRLIGVRLKHPATQIWRKTAGSGNFASPRPQTKVSGRPFQGNLFKLEGRKGTTLFVGSPMGPKPVSQTQIGSESHVIHKKGTCNFPTKGNFFRRHPLKPGLAPQVTSAHCWRDGKHRLLSASMAIECLMLKLGGIMPPAGAGKTVWPLHGCGCQNRFGIPPI